MVSGCIVDALTASRKFNQEIADGETKTNCVTIFLRPREEDGSIIITAGSRMLLTIREALEMSEWKIN